MTFPSPRHGVHVAANVVDLTLMPTEQCNFRCTYCYEDFRLQRMSGELVRAIGKFLARRAPGLELLSLSWFGGEPMLALDVVEEIQARALSLAEEYPRLQVRASMTTNGYLLSPPRLARLLELGVNRFQVSLDGAREMHDRRRMKAGGQGTFDRIWRNLRAARRQQGSFEIVIRIHVDRDNRASMPEFIRQMARSFGGDPRFRVFIRQVSRLGGAGDASLPVLGTRTAATLDALRELARAAGLKQHESDPRSSICYAAAANSFVIRSNGEIAKCTVALAHPNNRVGRVLRDFTAVWR